MGFPLGHTLLLACLQDLLAINAFCCIGFIEHDGDNFFQTLHGYKLDWGLQCHQGLMAFILFQGHMCVRNVNCKLRTLDYCSLYFKRGMVPTCIDKIMYNIICVTLVYIQGR